MEDTLSAKIQEFVENKIVVLHVDLQIDHIIWNFSMKK